MASGSEGFAVFRPRIDRIARYRIGVGGHDLNERGIAVGAGELLFAFNLHAAAEEEDIDLYDHRGATHALARTELVGELQVQFDRSGDQPHDIDATLHVEVAGEARFLDFDLEIDP